VAFRGLAASPSACAASCSRFCWRTSPFACERSIARPGSAFRLMSLAKACNAAATWPSDDIELTLSLVQGTIRRVFFGFYRIETNILKRLPKIFFVKQGSKVSCLVVSHSLTRNLAWTWGIFRAQDKCAHAFGATEPARLPPC